MNAANIEASLSTLKENYDSLSQAYRRGELEGSFPLTLEEGFIKKIFKKMKIRSVENVVLFRDVGTILFDQAHALDESDWERANLGDKVKEQLAEYTLSAKVLSYEISDYFLTTNNDDMSGHFEKLAHDAAADVKKYYKRHYPFVATRRVKSNIVKQLVLGILSGVNSLYRSYDTTKFAKGLGYVDDIIGFLNEDFVDFCERKYTARGLLGLAYFLKGKLLLGVVRYEAADDCFRLSAENYVKKLPSKVAVPDRGARRGEGEDESAGGDPVRADASGDVLARLLALRRAALVLAFGSGYTALISSRVKEANRLFTLARGILHFNSPPVYAAYTELLYWSAKRAEHSGNSEILAEAKEGIEGCREVFNSHVPDSHYPHRASVEHALVLHYLAQKKQPNERAAYYRDAVKELKAAVTFARGDGGAQGRNGPLLAEACYILCHILRYQASEFPPDRAGHAVELLREAFNYAKEAEGAAKHASRHKCEALLALCGVYADMAKRNFPLSEVDRHNKSGASPASLSRVYACKALDVNSGANNRISAICYLRLVDYYLKNQHTYARAYGYWDAWLKIRDSVEHGFVLEWAARTETEVEATKVRNLVIDLADVKNIDELRDEVNIAYARHALAAWVQDVHKDYKFLGEKIVKKNVSKPGPKESLQTMLEGFLEAKLDFSESDAKAFIRQHKLFEMTKSLMESYMIN